ncbi:MAG: sigma-54 interaction domain-containing protein [Candidatus Binataceae bacterium]
MLVGQSQATRRVISLIERVAPTTASVMITGESGTGKELTALSIHAQSPRRNRPFVPINCAAVPENLIESELFGHERGAFTGAHERREGCFEQADSGTLFLDEITEMRLEMQAKLLRVLEEKKSRRVGGSRPIPFDVRVLAATNRQPIRAIREGRLREDLYFRLNVLSIELPPLRNRVEDLPLLAEEFLRQFNQAHSKSVQGFEDDCLTRLKTYSWPGNVRELRNVVERAVIMCPSSMLSIRDLPVELTYQIGPALDLSFAIRPGASLKEVQVEFIFRTLQSVNGDKTRAARILGIGRRTLYGLIERHNIHVPNSDANGRGHRHGRNGIV